MPQTTNNPPTYTQIIESILKPLTGMIPVEDLIDQVQAIRPSKAKKPRKAIRDKIRELEGRLLVRPEPSVVLPLHLVYQGVRFRIHLDRQMIDSGLLDIETILGAYLPRQFPLEQITLIDSTSQPIPFQLKKVSQQIDYFYDSHEWMTWHAHIKTWFRSQKMYHNDHILVTIKDWEEGIFRFEREKASARDSDLLMQRSRLLADIFYELLEKSTYETIIQGVAVPTAYAILPDKNGYPPDHWEVIIEDDERMMYDFGQIGYSDGRLAAMGSISEHLYEEPMVKPQQNLSREEELQVYRIKAALDYDPKIWRVIEIQGAQTLAELDSALRSAFNHDPYDHLAGFWKMVPREGRKRTRYREVQIGAVNPFEEAGGAGIQIAGLELQAGDKLRYVYDFGDWIEHLLTLESIDPPKTNQEYPREIARNQPRYHNCVRCQEKGEKTIGLYICLTCSNRELKEMVYCTDCADRHDDNHYMDEMLY